LREVFDGLAPILRAATMTYTKNQQRAFKTIDSNLQIIACAGSGKTQVISRRVVEILRARKKRGIGPGNIVAFTFTEKAAAELKDRIHRLCLEVLGDDTGLAEMFVGTIHAYCLNLLQQPPVYRYLKYSVLTEVQQRLLIDRNSSKSGLTSVPLLAGDCLRRWKDSALYQQVLGVLAEGDVDLKQVPKAVLEAAEYYLKLCDEHRYLDYTTIMGAAVSELKSNKKLQQRLKSNLKYLVVDEYQDVNPLQEELIRLLQGPGANLCVVGDDDQTIYQWRGSEVDNMIHFRERYPSVKSVRLDENFRSSRGIVMAARQVIERNGGRLPKKMDSTDAQKYERGDLLALQFPDVSSESQWMAAEIRSLIGTPYKDRADQPERGLAYSDMAVLLRSVNNDGKPVVDALRAANIPFVVGGVSALFDTPEAETIRDTFYFLAGYTPRNAAAPTIASLRRHLQQAWWGIKPAHLNKGLRFLEETKARIGSEMGAELYLQRVYQDFLARLEVREEDVYDPPQDGHTGELVFYNLGKFSQVISDFEAINFNSPPASLYSTFAGFLEFQAADYYPEGWEASGYAQPDAVNVMTVHQAKGMQWPAVFIPCLRRNRFPSRRQGGRSVWHVIPDTAVKNVDRYKGTVEDERRLFYVALTRAEKYLFCSWAPIPQNQQQRSVSDFFREFSDSEYVLGKEPRHPKVKRLERKQRVEDVPLPLTFSELRYFFDCPYLFKVRFLYGFDAPISRALGYGKSLHDALAEIHSESLSGRIPGLADVPRLVAQHLHLPFANAQIRDNLTKEAAKALARYLGKHGEELRRLEHVEKIVELKLSDGVVVSGRIDLIRHTDTAEIVIVDFKSDHRAQPEEITLKQLHVYAVGYNKLTGKNADLIEVHNLDDKGGVHREEVDSSLVAETLDKVVEAGRSLRNNHLPRRSDWCEKCDGCDVSGICRSRPAVGKPVAEKR
jgi:DNA helicase-2/ATP-dependent DNA helicase PcrA